MSDIHALSGAYAVDALDDIERAQFQRHLVNCDICTSEVESLREASALLAEVSAAPPSADLRARVLADIAAVRPLPPLSAPTAAQAPTSISSARRSRPRFLTAVAAAAAVVALGSTAVITQPWADESSQTISAVDRVLQAPDRETFTNDFAGRGNVTVIRSASLQEAVVVPGNLPPAPSGHAYALWLQHDNRMVPAGYLADVTAPILLSGDAITATGAAISIEVVDTAPTTPSDKVVALFDFAQV